MRRGLCLRDLPCLCRRGRAREARWALADGRGHARFRLRRAAELAALLPDQGDGRARRAHRDGAGTAGLSRFTLKIEGLGLRPRLAPGGLVWPFSAAIAPARQAAASFQRSARTRTD